MNDFNLSNEHIKICHWNIHGKKSPIIDDKLSDMEFIMQLGNCDYVVLTEIHSDEKDLHIPGYKLLKHKIRSKTHKGPKISGGIAAFAKENLEQSINVVPDTDENSIWVKIKSKNVSVSDLYIGTYYISPKTRKNNTNLFELLNDEIKRFKGKGDILIQGDFNARVGDENDFICYDQFLDNLFDILPSNNNQSPTYRNSEDKHTNPRGFELLDFCKTNEFLIVNGRKIGDLFGKYTSNQHNGSSAIDLLLSTYNGFEKISHFKVGDYIPWLSDHSPIFSEFKCFINKPEHKPPIKLYERDQGYIWNDNYKEQFRTFLSNHKEKLEDINTATTSQDLDPNILVQEIKNAILKTCELSNFKKRKPKKTLTTKYPWFDKECSDLKDHIRKLGKKLQSKQGNKALREELFRAKSNLKKMVKNKKRLHKKATLEEMSQCTPTEQKKYWKLVHNLSQNETNHTQHISPKTLSEHFKSILTSKRPVKMPPNSQITGKLDHPFTLDELEKATKSLKSGKATGLDTLSNEMILVFVETYPHIILTLFNTILHKNTTIHDWTKGVITAIHKKGPKSDPENYRGISILSCLGKFFTSIMYNRLLEFSIKNKILSPSQLGFIPGNRTSDAHIIIHNLIQKQCHINNERLYSCFIDFSKAFDTIPRDTLLRKLLQFGIDGNFFNVIKNIYSNDKICIKHENKTTELFEVNLGVKQGCILSPLLFNIFLADLPKMIEDDPHQTKTFEHPGAILWADDIVLFSESKEGLTSMLKTTENYCRDNELTLNTDKTKCMIFNKTGKLLRTPFYYNHTKLENVRKFKYLGFLITPSGEIKSGLKDLKDRALKAFFKLKNAMSDSFKDQIKITLNLFDTLIKPIMMYMSDFWGGLKPLKENNNPIEKIHIMACKHILGVQKQTTNVGVLLEIGRFPMQNLAIKAAIKNWERIHHKGKISEILKKNIELAKTEKLPWLNHIESILQAHNAEDFIHNYPNTEHPFIHKKIFRNLYDTFHQNAFQTISNPESKLRTYSLLKTEIGCEEYLHTIKNTTARQSITKFRLSNHFLEIEKGRHKTPKTPKEMRFCPFCPKSVEDEVHFLIECPTYEHMRNKMLNIVLENKQQFLQLSKTEKFIKIMTHENTTLIAKHIHHTTEIRNFLVKNPKRPI